MKKLIARKSIICMLLITAGHWRAVSQNDTINLENLSLKDLLNVKIVSVSKSAELLFDAPLSASVVTREQIERTGCTSIMEALRLVPGMIVREQSNGNYDIHLRGMDNVPPNSPFDVTSNTTTLVMINNRPVTSYLRGGTYWETLPVDINDVESIEVIRGPAAALYGPNAVNGVINILTLQPQKEGLYAVVNTLQGSNLTFINNASIGYRFNKKWNMIASGNYQSRDRVQTSYFEFNRNKWLDQPDYFLDFTGDTVNNINSGYPDPPLAIDKYAGNIFVNFTPFELVKISLSAGAQRSKVQKVSTENETTPLSEASSNSTYLDLLANVKGFSTQISYNGGTQATAHEAGRKYDFRVISGYLEYNFTKANLSVKPGLRYTSAVYDDRPYTDLVKKTGIFNARGEIVTKIVSIKTEYKIMSDKFRLIAGFSTNTFNHPDTTYLSYEFAATFKLNKKHLFRAVYSGAPRSSNIFDIYVNKVIAFYPTGVKKFTRLALEGNENSKLLTARMVEAGYRGTIIPKLNIDVELFNIHAQNYNTPVTSRPYTQLIGTDTIQVIPVRSTALPLQLHQLGITVSLNYSSTKLEVKPFITIQQTKAKNYAPFINTPDAGSVGAEQNNIYSGNGKRALLKSTPAVFGGTDINYKVAAKINIDLNAYYYSPQLYYHLSNIIFNDGVRGIDHIPAKLIMNARVSYALQNRLKIFSSVKNILDNKSREFFKTDDVPFMLLGGINYEF